jgi:hypothetical protein
MFVNFFLIGINNLAVITNLKRVSMAFRSCFAHFLTYSFVKSMFFFICMFQNIFEVVFTICLVYVFFIYVKLMCYLNKYVFSI